VAAEDTARRSLEHDIHDGLQQQLISLMAKLALARTQLATGSDGAAATLTSMEGEFRQAVRDLRELTRGIHPAVLTDRGLRPALETLAARAPLPVEVAWDDAAEGLRMTQQAEAAVYFGVAEVLNNVAKHARAQAAFVRLTTRDHELVVEVCDDGEGFDVATGPLRGLAGLRDRLEALGGSALVRSRPGGPTVVTMAVPGGGDGGRG